MARTPPHHKLIYFFTRKVTYVCIVAIATVGGLTLCTGQPFMSSLPKPNRSRHELLFSPHPHTVPAHSSLQVHQERLRFPFFEPSPRVICPSSFSLTCLGLRTPNRGRYHNDYELCHHLDICLILTLPSAECYIP